MKREQERQYCIIDHANKQKDLARHTPYEFWVRQVTRRDARESPPQRRSNAGRLE